MKQRGSALIISMMLIATIGAVAFGIAKLLYADTSIATTYENGAIAFYAAESGIEEGFLRYKYNKNSEVPYANVSASAFWDFGGNKVFRTNLTDGSVDRGVSNNTGIPGETLVSSSTKRYYDLRMGYLGFNNAPFYYHDVDDDGGSEYPDIFSSAYATGDYSFLKIKKDESKKFDLSNLNFTTMDLAIGLKFYNVGKNTATGLGGDYTTAKECKAMAEIEFLVDSGTTVKEYKMLTSFNPDTCSSHVGIEAYKMDAAETSFATGGFTQASGHVTGGTTNYDYYYSLNDALEDALNKAGGTILNTDKVFMSIKPLYYDAAISFMSYVCNGYKTTTATECYGIVSGQPVSNYRRIVTGPYSYITSTGYYGGTTRTLKANVDRQSGTLYDLYDYVLFKGN